MLTIYAVAVLAFAFGYVLRGLMESPIDHQRARETDDLESWYAEVQR